MTFAVLGATGQTGRATAEALLESGAKVRVVVRRAEAGAAWRERGAEVAIASLDDEAALREAFRGARGAYLLTPPDLTTDDHVGLARRRIEAAGRALVAAEVPHVVLLSSVGAHIDGETGMIRAARVAEQTLGGLGLAATFVRAGYFHENFGAVLGAAAGEGVFPTFLPADLTLPMVATRDIGRAAARALLDPPAPGTTRIIALVGPEDHSPADVAARLGGILERDLHVHEAGVAAVAPTLKGYGASDHIASLYREMHEAFVAGRIDYEPGRTVRRGVTVIDQTLRGLLQASR